jgi:hypothetical protein
MGGKDPQPEAALAAVIWSYSSVHVLASVHADVMALRALLKLSPRLLAQCTSLQVMTASLASSLEVYLRDDRTGPTIVQLMADIDNVRDALCKLVTLVDNSSVALELPT